MIEVIAVWRSSVRSSVRSVVMWAVAFAVGMPTLAQAQSIQLQPANRYDVDSTQVRLSRPPGNLAGLLLKPRNVSRPPVVLFLSGAGPMDRDGNMLGAPGKTDAIRQLAESLAVRGIASLRYDKRGVGESTKAELPEHEMRFEVFAHDAASWIWDTGKRSLGPLIVAGYDEGGFAGILSRRDIVADGYITLAMSARRADEILREQLRTGPSGNVSAQVDSIIKSLRKGDGVDRIPIGLSELFRPTLQPYLMSWMAYSPATELSRLDKPCLIVHGAFDVQVNRAEADTLAKAQPYCMRVIIDSMTHSLKRGASEPERQEPSWMDPNVPLATGLVPAIAGFVDLLTRKTPDRCGADSSTNLPQLLMKVGDTNTPRPASPVILDGEYLGPYNVAVIPKTFTDSITSAVMVKSRVTERYGPTAARCGLLRMSSREALAGDSAEAIAAVLVSERAAHDSTHTTLLTLMDSASSRIVSGVLHRELVRRGLPIALSATAGADTALVAVQSYSADAPRIDDDGVVAAIVTRVKWSQRSTNGTSPCTLRTQATVRFLVRRRDGKLVAERFDPEMEGSGICTPGDAAGSPKDQ